jgi:hypothetical protein
LFGIGLFADVIYAAWRTRRQPPGPDRQDRYHRAALGRIPWGQIGVPPSSGGNMAIGVLLLLVIVYDLVALHRLHRSTMCAAPLTFVVNVIAVPIGMTSAWHGVAAFLNRTVGPHV